MFGHPVGDARQCPRCGLPTSPEHQDLLLKFAALGRKPYSRPKLTRYGTINDITQSANLTGRNSDGGRVKGKPAFT